MSDLGGADRDTELRFLVADDEAGSRLDRLLVARAPWRSRSWFHKRFAAGAVKLDDAVSRPSRRVLAGQTVEVVLGVDDRPDRGADVDDGLAAGLVVFHEDEHLALVEKPAGMVVHPVGGYRKQTLINLLHRRYRHEDPALARVPTLVNRLDKYTSGVVAVALSDEARARTNDLFSDHRRVHKTYLALVEGAVRGDAGIWDAPLAADRKHHVRLRRCVDREAGKPASTRWRVRESFLQARRPATMLELTLETGRKHQIRVHAADAGHPILADRIYGDLLDPMYYDDADPAAFAAALAEFPIQRHALHAWRLAFPHPITGDPIAAESPIPADFVAAIEALRA